MSEEPAKPIADAPVDSTSSAVEPVAHVEVTASDAGKERPATPPPTEAKAGTDVVAQAAPEDAPADAPAASPKTSKRTPRKKKAAATDSPAPAGAATEDNAAAPDSPAAEKTPARRTPRGPRASRGTPRTPANASSADASGSPATESKRSVVDLRAIISSREAGTIIGKGGATVAALRERTGCKAGVSKAVPGVQERVLSVAGSTESISQAYFSIAEALLENPGEDGSSTLVAIRLLVSHNHMGTVIGKAGAQIQQIQQASGARMAASKELLPQSTERVVEVTGTPEQVRVAVHEIARCIGQNPASFDQGTILFHPGAIGPDGPASTAGALVAANAGFLPQASPSGTPRRVSGGGPNVYASFGPRGSPRGSPSPAVDGTPSRSPRTSPPVARGRSSLGGASPGVLTNGTNLGTPARGGRSGPTSPLASKSAPSAAEPTELSNEERRTQNINIPSDMVGCIIGRAGAKIAEIRRLSGSKITIAKTPVDESGERLITLVGSAVENEKALFLLYEALEDEKIRRQKAAAAAETATPIEA